MHSVPLLRFVATAGLCVGIWSTLHFAMVSAGSARIVLDGFVWWALLPYVPAGLSCVLARGTKRALFCLLGCVFLSGLGVAAYGSGLAHPDAQNGLLLVFIPIWQLVVGVVLLIITAAATYRQTAPTTSSHDTTR